MVRLIGPTGIESRKPLRKPVKAATTVGGSSAIISSGAELDGRRRSLSSRERVGVRGEKPLELPLRLPTTHGSWRGRPLRFLLVFFLDLAAHSARDARTDET